MQTGLCDACEKAMTGFSLKSENCTLQTPGVSRSAL